MAKEKIKKVLNRHQNGINYIKSRCLDRTIYKTYFYIYLERIVLTVSEYKTVCYAHILRGFR